MTTNSAVDKAKARANKAFAKWDRVRSEANKAFVEAYKAKAAWAKAETEQEATP